MCVFVLSCAWVASTAAGATSSTIVGATVPSATSVGAAGCAPLEQDRTDFGIVQPGSSAVTSLDCRVTFGSSNDTSQLRLFRTASTNTAMTTFADRYDPSWGGGDGAAGYDVTSGGGSFTALELQGDGKLVAAGYDSVPRDVVVGRFLSDGTPDTASFASPTGYARVDIGGFETWVHDMTILADGRIAVTGHVDVGAHDDGFVMVFTSNGLLDTAGFGSPNGYVQFDVGATNDRFSSIDQLSDGRIVVGGFHNDATNGDQALVAAYSTSGVLDTSGFASPTGYHLRDYAPGPTGSDQVDDLVVGPGDTITYTSRAYIYDMSIVRLTATGVLDTSFASPNGFVDVAMANYRQPTKVELLDDGRIFVTLTNGGIGNTIELRRYRLDGTLDPTFNTTGIVTITPASGSTHPYDPTSVLMADGSYVVLAFALSPSDMTWHHVAEDGEFLAPSATAQTIRIDDGGRNISIAGRAIAAGGVVYVPGRVNGGEDLAAFRLAGAEIPDYDDTGVGTGDDWDDGAGAFGTCLRALGAGGTADWVVDGDNDCTAAVTDPWQGIPASSASPNAKVAHGASNATGITVDLRMGLRVDPAQAPGTYLAPITFEVLAPNA